ncbi:peptidoglycan-binding domain-containing protein [Ottowia testudinis]|uniref:Peptidoglycan-binding protein n=1 Tax=Ottowia testudinis TaxID=2816950 RepID=A0A975H5X7_9BURK|nr:peptidoglycan-binding domain-containing protein [Ottowia testudinis]QTD45422.1 peptidoglycan-binding protein [Ottowia testudinis]
MKSSRQNAQRPLNPAARRAPRAALVGGGLLLACAAAHAGMVTDTHGNVGYDSAAECDAAVQAGTARFYRPVTDRKPARQRGEASVRTIRLSELSSATRQAAGLRYSAADYARGACDLGIRHVKGRPDITPELVGKWVPFSPDMPLNLYSDAAGQPVRATMAQCDNGFSGNLPRPVPPVAAVAEQAPPPQAQPNQCFANILYPARFETRSEQVLIAPATQREEVVPATYKTVTEQVLVQPETRRQVAVPPEIANVTENVVMRPAGVRDEPVAPTFKSSTEHLVTRESGQRIEVVPPVYRTEKTRVVDVPEHTIQRVVPAVYKEVEEIVMISPDTTRTEVTEPRYRTEVERVLVRPEVLRYVPVRLPMKQVPEQRLRAEATTRVEALPPIMRTVVEPVEVRPATVRKVEVPAAYEIVTEQIKVSEPYREWRRGRAWVGQAIEVVPLRGFVVDPSGQFKGYNVAGRTPVPAAAGGASRGVIDTGATPADNRQLEDDVWCLVEVPAQYQTVQRQVLKSPATTSDVAVPAEYKNITKQVMVREATQRVVPVPAVYQNVYRQEVDFERARALGYKFDANGELVATPAGERLVRAASVTSQPGVQIDRSHLVPGADAWVREVRIPAEYKNVNRYVPEQPATVRVVDVSAAYRTTKRRVMVEPARTESVVVPATYKTVPTQVLVRAETTRTVPVPAELQPITRYELDQPASLRQVPVPELVQPVQRPVVLREASVRDEVVPAVHRTETRQVIDQPASTRMVDVAPVYQTLTWQVKVGEAREEKREVMCETNTAPTKIREVQQALQSAGFSPGAADGVLAAPTLAAVARYQQARGLPVHGYLDVETVRALGVAPN